MSGDAPLGSVPEFEVIRARELERRAWPLALRMRYWSKWECLVETEGWPLFTAMTMSFEHTRRVNSVRKGWVESKPCKKGCGTFVIYRSYEGRRPVAIDKEARLHVCT